MYNHCWRDYLHNCFFWWRESVQLCQLFEYNVRYGNKIYFYIFGNRIITPTMILRTEMRRQKVAQRENGPPCMCFSRAQPQLPGSLNQLSASLSVKLYSWKYEIQPWCHSSCDRVITIRQDSRKSFEKRQRKLHVPQKVEKCSANKGKKNNASGIDKFVVKATLRVLHFVEGRCSK